MKHLTKDEAMKVEVGTKVVSTIPDKKHPEKTRTAKNYSLNGNMYTSRNGVVVSVPSDRPNGDVRISVSLTEPHQPYDTGWSFSYTDLLFDLPVDPYGVTLDELKWSEVHDKVNTHAEYINGSERIVCKILDKEHSGYTGTIAIKLDTPESMSSWVRTSEVRLMSKEECYAHDQGILDINLGDYIKPDRDILETIKSKPDSVLLIKNDIGDSTGCMHKTVEVTSIDSDITDSIPLRVILPDDSDRYLEYSEYLIHKKYIGVEAKVDSIPDSNIEYLNIGTGHSYYNSLVLVKGINYGLKVVAEVKDRFKLINQLGEVFYADKDKCSKRSFRFKSSNTSGDTYHKVGTKIGGRTVGYVDYDTSSPYLMLDGDSKEWISKRAAELLEDESIVSQPVKLAKGPKVKSNGESHFVPPYSRKGDYLTAIYIAKSNKFAGKLVAESTVYYVLRNQKNQQLTVPKADVIISSIAFKGVVNESSYKYKVSEVIPNLGTVVYIDSSDALHYLIVFEDDSWDWHSQEGIRLKLERKGIIETQADVPVIQAENAAVFKGDTRPELSTGAKQTRLKRITRG